MYREECVKTVTENKSVYVFIVHWVAVCVCREDIINLCVEVEW